MGLEKSGIDVKPKSGLIEVDEFENTSREGIYAIGDVTGKVNLTPVAVRAGRILSERLFNSRPTLKMNYENVATVVFSHPPIGKLGLTESEAIKKFGEDRVKVHKSQFTNMFFSLPDPSENHR